MQKNSELTASYFQILDELDGDIEGRRRAFEYMKGSTAIVHHEVVACSYIPRLFDQRSYETMKRSSEMTHTILCKVMDRYLDDPEYRRLFDFDERLEKLILIPRRYESMLPFARVDVFFNEDEYDIKFCEFNGDGSAGMNENREITNSINDCPTMTRFKSGRKVHKCDLFEPWVQDFIKIYSTFENKVEKPTFAICDYLENGVVDEFYIFAKKFEEAGYPCIVCDVRDLKYDGEKLVSPDGVRIDAIWRRCVTNDVIDHWDASQDLINAVEDGVVALIGSFAGHIVHDKQIFDVLMMNETLEFLTAEEISFLEQTIPMTSFLDERYVDLQQILNNKDEWIIKPADHYGADNVYAGCELTQQEWEEVVSRFANGASGYQFIVQRYIRPFRTETLPPDTGILDLPDDEVSSKPVLYNNLSGLYLYDGRFQGVFSRLGPHPTISKQNEGMTAATIWVDCDDDCGRPL